MAHVQVEDVMKLDENVYLIPSSRDANVRYNVNSNIGYCTCVNDKRGAFCKHQWFIMNYLNVKLPNALFLSAEDRHTLVEMTLGPQCLSEKYNFCQMK